MSQLLGREALGKKETFQTKEIPVPAWGGKILIRQMSHRQVVGSQMAAVQAVDISKQEVKDKGKLSRFGFNLIKESWINADGSFVLTDADYDLLVDEPDAIIGTIVKEIRVFNEMEEQAQANAKKNSGTNQNGASGTS